MDRTMIQGFWILNDFEYWCAFIVYCFVDDVYILKILIIPHKNMYK